ncbi:MAG: acyltransferase, partial [Actinobacteria bacterium]
LEFLDALRGIAAMMVVVTHFAERLWPEALRFSTETFRPGECGVVIFFICSGFIIPASLERRGSLRAFWIGRGFRLLPAYLAAVGAALLLHLVDRYPLAPRLTDDPVVGVVANATMAQHLLGQPLVLGQSWTLAYELVFYGLVSVLFVAGLHRRSVALSVALFAGALVAGNALKPLAVTTPDGSSRGLVVAITLAAVVLAVALARTTTGRIVAGVLTALAVPLVLNRPEPLWFALLVLGTMFVGTVLYRATTGQIPGWVGGAVFGFAMVMIVLVEWVREVSFVEPTTGAVTNWRAESLTFVVAYLVFGGALLLRRFHFPKVLVWLGAISYSLYLWHALVLRAISPTAYRPLTFAVWLAAAIVVSALSYRWIEQPFIRMGRSIAASKPAKGA